MRFPLLALVFALAAIPAAAWWHTFSSTGIPAPDFTLTSSDAQSFVLSAQRGHPVVLFFGYTHCPDACPTTLAHIAAALRRPGVPHDVRVAFITVDPARDSVAGLKRYAALFAPSFQGLTGTRDQLDRVYDAYHVVRAGAPSDAGATAYSVQHTTTVYYIGRGGSLDTFGNWDDSVTTVATDLRQLR